MNIFVYSDESGVFDKVHNDIFVFGGTIFLSKTEKDIAARKYINAEHIIRNSEGKTCTGEIKACSISNAGKSKLFRSLNHCVKFGVVVNQKKSLIPFFKAKKINNATWITPTKFV